ncbi:MAG: glycine--tRNA ligase subunit beta [Gammaproteobacteria bacterium]|nr:glycine--tRNA ligase subunit beta [Gammaproteobacteria bacterium]
MSRDILFELGVEELPSAAVSVLGEALASHLAAGLTDARLSYGDVQAFATPRRLAVQIKSVQLEQAPQQVSRLGPKKAMGFGDDGVPTKALLGFARSCGVTVDDLAVKNTPKGERFAYDATEIGLTTAELLPGMVHEAVQKLPIAKRMRWGDGEVGFVRPVHWVVLLLGQQIIDVSCFGCDSGRNTVGHRYHHPEAIALDTPADYLEALHDARVIADFSTRRAAVEASIHTVLEGLDAEAVIPERLLDEVTAIVEWPSALLVDFSPKFLEIPPEVLIESMQSHQKCFAVRNKAGALLPHFITVSNIESCSPEHVIHGNQRVMFARLSDADFFYTEDKKQTLESRVEATKKVVFQSALGSLYDKTARIEQLIAMISPALSLDSAEALDAVNLSKCDLLTGMVGEFPELQGTMGYYYALHDGASDALALAMKEQYLPRFSADSLPGTVLGAALSLADRLDTLVGIFGIDQKPTGERDPFKLRRHALAVVRLLNSIPVSLSLSDLLETARAAYGEQFASNTALVSEVKAFILDRLPAFYQTMPHAVERVRAALAKQSDCLRDLDVRVKALALFEERPEAVALAAASKRVTKLLKQAHLGLDEQVLPVVDDALFEVPAEQRLFAHVESLEAFVSVQHAERGYGAILLELATLDIPVNAFFEDVMVMVENTAVKTNRLKLLARLQLLLQSVADVSLLPQTA